MSGEADQVKWHGVQQIAGVDGIWPSKNAERVNKYAYQVGTGSKIIYTVPTGKKLFISHASLASLTSPSAIAGCTVTARNESDVEQYWINKHVYSLQGQQVHSDSFIPALEVNAGWDVVINCDNTMIWGFACIFGWLEDA